MRIIKPIEIIDVFRYIEGFNPTLKQICELLEKNRLDLTQEEDTQVNQAYREFVDAQALIRKAFLCLDKIYLRFGKD